MNTFTLHCPDSAPLLRGRVRMEVYEGDIRREPIPLWQHAHNAAVNLRWRLLRIPASRYYRGRILNKLVHVQEKDNLVLTLGKQIMLDRLYGLGGVGALTHMGVGTDSTAASVGQNKLNPTVAGSVDFNAFDATPIRTSLTVASIATWGTGDGNFTWNEMGLAKSATNDGTNLFARTVIGPFTKSTAVSIVLTHSLTQA